MYIYYKKEWIQVNQNDDRVKELGIVIGEDAHIGTMAVIGANAFIGAYDKKIKADMIRIGCEIHTLQKWSDVDFQERLADKHDREWWNSRGKKILQFLMDK